MHKFLPKLTKIHLTIKSNRNLRKGLRKSTIKTSKLVKMIEEERIPKNRVKFKISKLRTNNLISNNHQQVSCTLKVKYKYENDLRFIILLFKAYYKK